MFEFLPEDIRKGLQAAQTRALRKSSRLSVHIGEDAYPILALGESGFTVETGRLPVLRGFVDIYDGPRHLLHALIIAASDEGGQMTYEFKRETPVHQAPIPDYVIERPEPDGFLPRPA
ncbi:hypothetical protein [Pararhodobacter sp. CCB-MM2]|uniref:hypothetical protein n=1 Tax=Pararhodobacter sp. CCB-MM2 TaxID=1786003 RepID=UPI0008364B70|nr:hypothetical protein [Pararhodobacter sp. CCB-MM2]